MLTIKMKTGQDYSISEEESVKTTGLPSDDESFEDSDSGREEEIVTSVGVKEGNQTKD